MSNTEIGALRVSLGLDSIDFSKGMQDINRKLKGLSTEFKAATAGNKDFENTLEGMRTKSQYLNNVFSLQGQRVQELKRQYDQMKATKGEDAKETENLAIRYNQALAAMKNTEQQLKQVNTQLDRQSGITGQLQASLAKVGEQMQDLGGRMQMAGQSIATSFGAATATLAAGLGLATKKAMDFEAQMSAVKSVMSPEEALQYGESLEELATIMGAKTKYSALEAARGIEELVKAGVSVTDIINGGLDGALSLATAGELELADAAAIASQALNAFKADGVTVGQAADILAGAANASATSVGELQYGLSAVAAVASGAGMSFKDTSTALAVFAQNGLLSSDAGTSLKTMLMNLSPSTKAAAETMSDLGIIMKDGTNQFFNANGELKSLAEVTDVLRTALVNLNPKDRGDALKEMFGSDAIRAGNILFKEGAEGINAMATAMGKIKAADVAAEKLNNLKGKMEELKGAFETGLISVGEALTPTISKIVEVLQKLVDGFNNLSPGMQQFISIGGLVTTALLGIGTAIGLLLSLIGGAALGIGALASLLGGGAAGAGLAGAASTAAGGTGLLASALSVITGPIGIAVAAIAGLVGAIVVLYNKNEEFRNKVNEIWSSIQQSFAVAMEFIKTNVTTVMTSVMNFFGDILTTIKGFWEENGERIMVVVKTTFQDILTTIQTVMGLIKGVFQVVWPIISGLVVVAWNLIKTSIKTTLDLILSIIEVGLNVLAGDWEGAWESIKDTAESIMNNIVGFFEDIDLWEIGQDIIQGLIDGIGSMQKAVMKKVDFLSGLIPKGMKDFLDINSPIKKASAKTKKEAKKLAEYLASMKDNLNNKRVIVI